MLFLLKLREQGNGTRTVWNRALALASFLRHAGYPDIVQKKEIPRYTQKRATPYNKRELHTLLAASSGDDRLLSQFFLGSGAREQEVMYACWSDINFEAGLFNIQVKCDYNWTLKAHEERSVPLPDKLPADLATLRSRHPKGRIIFPTPAGKPDGHLLRKLKRIAFHAGLNCGSLHQQGRVSLRYAPELPGVGAAQVPEDVRRAPPRLRCADADSTGLARPRRPRHDADVLGRRRCPFDQATCRRQPQL